MFWATTRCSTYTSSCWSATICATYHCNTAAPFVLRLPCALSIRMQKICYRTSFLTRACCYATDIELCDWHKWIARTTGNEMNGDLGHDSATVRLYWAKDSYWNTYTEANTISCSWQWPASVVWLGSTLIWNNLQFCIYSFWNLTTNVSLKPLFFTGLLSWSLMIHWSVFVLELWFLGSLKHICVRIKDR